MTPPSWQPDPMGRHELRWWDGQRWTDHVSDGGSSSMDPMQTPQPNAWAAPTAPAVVAPLPTVPTPSTSGRRRTPLLIGAIVAVLVVGVGLGVLIISGDDSASQVVATTTTEATSDSSAPADSVATTEPAPTTDVGADQVDGETLTGALPGIADVPNDWVQKYEGDLAVEAASGPGYGYCGGGNAVARAQEIGNPTIVYGPGWGLPDGSTFGADLLVFDTADQAQRFLDGTLEQANACAADPVSFTASESDVDWLADGFGDDAEWTVLSLSSAVAGSSSQADSEVRGYVADNYSATVGTSAFSVTYSTISVYERHGRAVILFWTDGSWDFNGFASTPEWSHRPDDTELDRNIATYRDLIVSRLEEIGAL